MERQQGSLHLVRRFQNLDGSHVCDVTGAANDCPAAVDNAVIRRFASEQGLTEWLKKDLRRGPAEVEDLMWRFERENRVTMPGPQFRPEELKSLKLAA